MRDQERDVPAGVGGTAMEDMKCIRSDKKKSRLRRGAGLWLAASMFVATAAEVTAPSLGYLPVGGKIQSVDGIPAAAHLATVVNAPEFAMIATAGEVALGVDTASGAVTLISGGEAHAISGIDANPVAIALSPSGTVAAAWFAEGRGQAIALEAGAAVQSANVPFLSGAPESFVVSDAVSEQGIWIAGAWSAGAYALGPNAEVLALPVNTGVFAFASGELALVAADSSTLWEVSAPAQGFDATTLADLRSWQDDGTAPQPGQRSKTGNRGRVAAPPAGVAMDSEWVTAALRNGKVVRLARDSQGTKAPTVSDCHCSPDGLTPLRGSVYRLAGADATQATLLYDEQRDRIWRVQPAPVQVDAAAQGGAQ